MLTPKKTFKDSPHAKGWQSVCDSTQFQLAVTAAKLQMDFNAIRAPDMATAAARHWKMEGATEFLNILMNLTRPDVPDKKPLKDNLIHTL